MIDRRPIQQGHERAYVQHFLTWFNRIYRCNFRVVAEPNPPEAIICSPRTTRWIEVGTAFWSGAFAQDLYSYCNSWRSAQTGWSRLISRDGSPVCEKLCHRGEEEVGEERAVIDELSHPDFPRSQEALALVSRIQTVPIVEEVRQIVRSYIQNRIMPANPVGDALHLALASRHKCDYLLTWNCKHIANPNKFRQIRMCNISMGLYVPFLVTPNQLIGG